MKIWITETGFAPFKNMGIKGSYSLSWFQSYLWDRQQYVSVPAVGCPAVGCPAVGCTAWVVGGGGDGFFAHLSFVGIAGTL